MNNEVIQQVCQRTGLSEDKAEQAVQTVVAYLKEKLPGPVGGQIESALQGGGGVTGALGSVFGKKSA
jgi:nucleoid DNA-binding protein